MTVTLHDIRYLRDDEIPLSNKMRAFARTTMTTDFRRHLLQSFDAQRPEESLLELSRLWVLSMHKNIPNITFKIQSLDENERMLQFSYPDGRRLFYVHVTW